MRRFMLATLFFLTFSAFGAGCQNIGRIGCEFKNLYLDAQRNIFGIDYPHGLPETNRQLYFGIPAPGRQPICDD